MVAMVVVMVKMETRVVASRVVVAKVVVAMVVAAWEAAAEVATAAAEDQLALVLLVVSVAPGSTGATVV